jgi:DNA-binding protein HU-beta
MKKSDVIEAMEAKGMKKAQAASVLTMLAALAAESLANGDRVILAGIGILTVRQRTARIGRNPKTGEQIQIQARKVIHFKPASALRQRLGG